MTAVVLPKTGLVTQSKGDLDWDVKLNEGLQSLEARTGMSASGDPNGALAGSFYGQTYFDRTVGEFYECTSPGPATGSFRAIWSPRTGFIVGLVAHFMRTALPTGWLRMDGGTYLRASYPRLSVVLPNGVVGDSTTFTLPNVNDYGILMRMPTSIQPGLESRIGHLAKQYFVIPAAPDSGYSFAILNTIVAVKY